MGQAPLKPKGGAWGGTGCSQPEAVFRLVALSKGLVTAFQALQIRATSWAPQAPLLAVGLGSHWTAKGDRGKVEGIQRRVGQAPLKPKGGA